MLISELVLENMQIKAIKVSANLYLPTGKVWKNGNTAARTENKLKAVSKILKPKICKFPYFPVSLFFSLFIGFLLIPAPFQ